jgi:DHA1 family multidrug resistance protein-like MFS transporter
VPESALVRPLTASLRDRGLPREVYVLAAVAFAVAVGFGIVAPIIPVFAREEFGVGRTAAGAVISAFAFMRLVSALAGGRLVDRLGERWVLATGIGIVAVSSLLAGLAQNYQQLILLRGVGGLGSAMFTVSAMSLLLRTVEPHLRGRATGLWQAGFLVGGVSGPFLGGVIGAISLRAPFFVYAGTLAIAGTIAMVFLSHAPLLDKSDDSGALRTTSLASALRHPAYRAALVTNLGVGWMLFGVRSSLIPLFVAEALGKGPLWIGIGFLVGSAAQAAGLWPAGRVADQIGRKPAMIGGGLLAVVGLALLVASATLAAFLVSMAMYGLAAAFLGVAPGAVVGDVLEGRGGTVVAAFQMAADFGAVVGPLAAGWLADTSSYNASFAATAVVVAAGTVMALRMPETMKRPPARTTPGGESSTGSE